MAVLLRGYWKTPAAMEDWHDEAEMRHKVEGDADNEHYKGA